MPRAYPGPSPNASWRNWKNSGFSGAAGELAGAGADADRQLEAAGRRRQAVLGSRIDSMRHYAETTTCRRRELLGYFGEALDSDCGNCDNDARRAPATPKPAARRAAPAGSPAPIAIGAAVTHRLWGDGTVLSADDHELVVAFESVGYRHLTRATLSNGLLTPRPEAVHSRG